MRKAEGSSVGGPAPSAEPEQPAAEEELGDGFDGVVVHVDNLAVLRRR